MTPEERERLNNLCKRIEDEQNPKVFNALVEELNVLLRSPTGDAVTLPASWPWPRWLASFRFFHHDRLTSVPSVADHSRYRMVPRYVVLPAPTRFADRDRLLW